VAQVDVVDLEQSALEFKESRQFVISRHSSSGSLVMIKKYKILVVDDERAIADTLAAILNSTFEVHVAYSGRQAIDKAALIEPDLVLSDVMMPDKNGLDVATEISEEFPNCKILLFSGSAKAADMLLQARQAGKNWEIISKPIHPHDLLVKLDDLAA
jgi:CheY-like chemotaxis protein